MHLVLKTLSQGLITSPTTGVGASNHLGKACWVKQFGAPLQMDCVLKGNEM